MARPAEFKMIPGQDDIRQMNRDLRFHPVDNEVPRTLTRARSNTTIATAISRESASSARPKAKRIAAILRTSSRGFWRRAEQVIRSARPI